MSNQTCDFFLQISAPFSEAGFSLIEIQGAEGISQPFQFALKGVASDARLDPREWLGNPVGFWIRAAQPEPQFYRHGIVWRVEQFPPLQQHRCFVLHVGPALQRLSTQQHSRTWQNRTALEMLRDVVGEPFSHEIDASLLESTKTKIPYWVQYQESNWEFLLRLIHAQKWNFIFQHSFTEQKHSLTLLDNLAKAPWCAQPLVLSNQNMLSIPMLYGWRSEKAHASDTNTPHLHINAQSTYQNLTPAIQFQHNEKPYRILSLEHWACDPSRATAETTNTVMSYRNQFHAQPTEQTALLLVLKPLRFAGIKYANVTELNAKAKLRVNFEWDENNLPQNSSTPALPTNQHWAGVNEGKLFTPALGQDVALTYLEGNPLKPLVLGVMPNATHPPRYAIPSQQGWSGIKTQQHEFGFNDSVDDPGCLLRASGSFHKHIRSSETVTLQRHDRWKIEKNSTETIQGKYRLHSQSGITLGVGETQIALHPDKIQIKAQQIHINAQAAMNTSPPQRKNLHELGFPHALVNGKAAQEKKSKSLNPSNKRPRKNSAQHHSQDYLCIPVQPRWRKLTAPQKLNDLATLLRLPQALREQVQQLIFNQFSAIANATHKQSDPMQIAQAGLIAEASLILPRLEAWQVLLQQHAPQLYQQVQQQLKAQHTVMDSLLPPGWIYVFVSVKNATQWRLFAEYYVQEDGYAEIDLSTDAGLNQRETCSAVTDFIAIPYLNKANQALECRVFYSDIQLSWPRLHAFGGMREGDPRLSEAKQQPRNARALQRMQSVRSDKASTELRQRAGASLELSGWTSSEHDMRRTSETVLDVVITKTSHKITPANFFASQDEATLQQHDLVRAQASEIPYLLLDNPIGMNVLAIVQINSYSQAFQRLISSLTKSESASYLGDNDIVEKNYFHTAVLVQQLFYNALAMGVYRENQYILQPDNAFQFNVGEAAALINANRYLDRNKVNWVLRRQDRRLLKHFIQAWQTVSAQTLQHKPSAKWEVDILSALRDGFAVGPAQGYGRLFGMLAFSCQNANTLDNALDIDDRFQNQLQVKQWPGSVSGNAFSPPVTVEMQRTRYIRSPGGYLKLVEQVVSAQDTKPRVLRHEFIADELPPGMKFFIALHQVAHPLHRCLFPTQMTREQTSDAIYVRGEGTFWPAGFESQWQFQRKPAVETAFDFMHKSAELLEPVVAAWIGLASVAWYQQDANQVHAMRTGYLQLLAHGDPAFSAEKIVLQNTQALKGYRLLSATLAPKREPKIPHANAVYAAIAPGDKLQFYSTAVKAEAVTRQRSERQYHTGYGKLTLTYVKQDFEPSSLMRRTQAALDVIHSTYALYDLWQNLRTGLNQGKDVETLLDSLAAWTRVMGSALMIAEKCQPLCAELFSTQDEFVWLSSEKIAFAATTCAMIASWMEMAQAWGRGDKAATFNAGIEAIVTTGHEARALWGFLKQSRSVVPEVEGASLRLYAAEELSALIPGVDLFDVAAVTLLLVQMMLKGFEDTPLDTWARRSPFSKQYPPLGAWPEREPLWLYEKLLTLILMPQFIARANGVARQVYCVLPSLEWLGEQTQLVVEGRWVLCLVAWYPNSSVTTPPLNQSNYAEECGPISSATYPIYSVPENKLIGAMLSIPEPSAATLQPLYRNLLQKNPAPDISVTDSLLVLEYRVRAQLRVGAAHMPVAGESGEGAVSQDNFSCDENYWHSPPLFKRGLSATEMGAEVGYFKSIS